MSRTLSGLFLIGALNRPRRGKGQIGKIPGPSPSKLGKSQKNRERPKKDKKGRTSPDRETPPFKTPRLADLDNFLIQKALSPELWWIWGTFAGTLMNVWEVLVNMALWLTRSSPNFARLRYWRALNGRGLTVQMICSNFLRSAFFLLAAGNCYKLQETAGTYVYR